MNGAKIILHSSNSGNLRGGARAASSSLWGQAVVEQEDLFHTNIPRSVSPSSPRAFFHSSPITKAANHDNLWESSFLDFFDDTTSSSNPQNIRSSSSSVSTETSRTPSSSPPLLLEGDNYHISRDGIARTLYRMRRMGADAGANRATLVPSSGVVFAVEELYDLHGAKKNFVLRRDCQPSQNHTAHAEDFITVGEAIQEVDLQEIAAGVLGGGAAGTGATTWESSILMAMYFASRPETLSGDAVELGSGVGLGGIICALGPRIFLGRKPINSITLTDINPMVLEQCRKNVKTIIDACTNTGSRTTPLSVSKLDWYDFLPHSFEKSTVPNQLFDTIIACDCAYRHQDIAALAATMTSLLRDDNSRIHIFGPSNRSGLDDLLALLREEYELSVTVQPLDMERYRLRPPSSERSHLSDLMDSVVGIGGHEFLYATLSLSSFSHIICSPKRPTLDTHRKMSDID